MGFHPERVEVSTRRWGGRIGVDALVVP